MEPLFAFFAVSVGLILGSVVYYGFKRFGRPAKEVAG